MDNTADLEIREALLLYLTGRVGLHDFQDWFDPVVTRMLARGGRPTQLAMDIELRLAENARGHWSESSLKEIFSRLLESLCIDANLPAAPVRRSSSRTIELSAFGPQFTAQAAVSLHLAASASIESVSAAA